MRIIHLDDYGHHRQRYILLLKKKVELFGLIENSTFTRGNDGQHNRDIS